MIQALGQAIVRYPTSFGVWAMLLQTIVQGVHEIAVVGERAPEIVKEIITHYIPIKIIQSNRGSDHFFPLLDNRHGKNDETLIFLCKNYACEAPVTSVKELLDLL